MKKIKIYLAGKMCGLTFEEMNGWRIKAKDLINQYLEKQVIIINPVENYPFEIRPDLLYEKEAMEFDLHQVMDSNLILVKLENSIGTAIELYEAYKHTKIPVIGYVEKNQEVHPWIKLCCHKITNSLEDAIEYSYNYYLKNM